MDRDPDRSPTFKRRNKHFDARFQPRDAALSRDSNSISLPPIHQGFLVDTIPRPNSDDWSPVSLYRSVLGRTGPDRKNSGKSIDNLIVSKGDTFVSPVHLIPKPSVEFGQGLELVGTAVPLHSAGEFGIETKLPPRSGMISSTSPGFMTPGNPPPFGCVTTSAAAPPDSRNSSGDPPPGGSLTTDDPPPGGRMTTGDPPPCGGTTTDDPSPGGGRTSEVPPPNAGTTTDDPLPGGENTTDDPPPCGGITSDVPSPGGGKATDDHPPCGCKTTEDPPSGVDITSDNRLPGPDRICQLSKKGTSTDVDLCVPITEENNDREQKLREQKLRQQARAYAQGVSSSKAEIRSDLVAQNMTAVTPTVHPDPRPPSVRKPRSSSRRRPPVRYKATSVKMADSPAPPNDLKFAPKPPEKPAHDVEHAVSAKIMAGTRASPDGSCADGKPTSLGDTQEGYTMDGTASTDEDMDFDVDFDYAATCPALQALSPQQSYLGLASRTADLLQTPSPESSEIFLYSSPTAPPAKVLEGDGAMSQAFDKVSTSDMFANLSTTATNKVNDTPTKPKQAQKKEKSERKTKQKQKKAGEAKAEDIAKNEETARNRAEKEAAEISRNRSIFNRKKDTLPGIGQKRAEVSFYLGKLPTVKEPCRTKSAAPDTVDIINRHDSHVRVTAYTKQISQDYINARNCIWSEPEDRNKAPEIIELHEDTVGRPYERYGGVPTGYGNDTGKGNAGRCGSARRHASSKSRCSSAVSRRDA